MFDITYWLPVLGSGTPGFLFSMLLYVAFALGVYKIARHEGSPRAWLAWIPFVRWYLLGKLADAYRARQGKKAWHLGVWMLIASILHTIALAIYLLVFIGFYLVFFGFYFLAIICGAAASAIGTAVASFLPALLMLFMLGAMLVAIPVLTVIEMVFGAAALAFTTIKVLTLTYVFEASTEKHADLCVVLSLLFDFVAPILLFVCSRNLAAPAAEPTEITA